MTPRSHRVGPAIVLASAIHGVDDDVRAIADEFALAGYIAAAPDLFWRTLPGPLARGDRRAAERAQPRLQNIKTGEQDLQDVLRGLRKKPLFNGRSAIVGFCYGGPYAVVGPIRLGYDAGIACHGTHMLPFIHELDDLKRPVCLFWGDQDEAAPAPVLQAYRAASAHNRHVEVHVLAGVQHGYMMHGSTKTFDQRAYTRSMRRCLDIMEDLRNPSATSDP